MTRGRMIWLALLALGLVVSLLLRTPQRERAQRPAPELRAAASRAAGNTDESGEVEIEVADPREVGLAPNAATSAGSGPVDEAELLRTLDAALRSDPERALALAKEGERRFGESPRAVERRLIEIKALVKLGRIGSARTKAEGYLVAYPSGPMSDEVERLTGVHRRPPP